VSMAKFSIKSLPLNRRKKIILLSGVGGVVLIGGVAAAVSGPVFNMVPAPAPAPIAAPKPIVVVGQRTNPAPTPTPTPAPFAGPQRLAALDGLRAQIEQEKLEAELEEVRAKKRSAQSGLGMGAIGAGPSTAGAAAMPPMPAFPAGGINSMMPPVSLDMPPVPPSRRGGAIGGLPGPSAQSGGGTEFLEAWGSGSDIQARVMTNAGERIVRVGDAVPGGRVTSISGSALTVTDARGKRRTFN